MRLLLVEDDPLVRRGLVRALPGAFDGCDLVTAISVSHAVACLKYMNVDVVVTDWHLGDHVATDVVVLARERGIPCVVHSSDPGPEAEMADRIVLKGGPLSELFDAIREVAP